MDDEVAVNRESSVYGWCGREEKRPLEGGRGGLHVRRGGFVTPSLPLGMASFHADTLFAQYSGVGVDVMHNACLILLLLLYTKTIFVLQNNNEDDKTSTYCSTVIHTVFDCTNHVCKIIIIIRRYNASSPPIAGNLLQYI